MPSLKATLERGDLDALRTTLRADPAAVGQVIAWGPGGKNRCSPLHYVACLHFHGMGLDADTAAMAGLLLEHGADIESRASKPGGDGETPLQTAVSLYDREVVDVLLERDADLEATGSIIDDGSALAVGVHFASLACVERLLAHGARVFNLPLSAGVGHDLAPWFDADGSPVKGAGARHPRLEPVAPPAAAQVLARALQYAAINCQVDTLTDLLDRGGDVATQVDDASLLHWCAWWGAAATAEVLLQRGADPALRDPVHTATPYEWAGYRHQTLAENSYRLVPGLDDVARVLRTGAP